MAIVHNHLFIVVARTFFLFPPIITTSTRSSSSLFVSQQCPIFLIPILLFILTQLKDLRHDNICAFIGACTEPPNICIITEYCSRGSLKDVLENEDVKLDNMFLASMVADIIRVSVEIQRKPIDANCQLNALLTDILLQSIVRASFTSMTRRFASMEICAAPIASSTPDG